MNYREEEIEVVPNAWSSELPADILYLITDKLRSSFAPPEYIRFGCVCLGWRSFSIQNYQHIKLPNQVPLLLIPIPPSLLSTVHHHHQKMMTPSSPPSIEEEEEEEVGEEDNVIKEVVVVVVEEVIKEEEEEEVVVEEVIKEEEEEEVVVVVVAVEEEVQDEDEDEDEDEDDDDDDDEDEDEDDDDEYDYEYEECEELKELRRTRENYYSPTGVWEGQGQDHKQRYKSTRLFYSLSEKMVYHDFPLPVPYYKNIRGSSYGWLVTVEECYADNGEVYLPVRLLNPFRTDNNEIQLPTLVNGYPGNLAIGEMICTSYFLKKAFISANPSSLSDPNTQLVVLGVYGHNRLAFCRPGDKTWTRLDLEGYRPIQDIICYKGEFYAILQSGCVFAFVFDAAQPLPTPIVTQLFKPPPRIMGINPTRYLVESGGDLLHVCRHVAGPTPAESGRPIPVEDSGYITSQFSVLKLDPMGQWVEIKTLNNRMLFIGQSSSMSLPGSDFPGGWSRRNSIYYTDDNFERYAIKSQYGPHDIGIFNLEDGSFERHYEAESKTIMPPPIWIQPML